MTDMIVENNDKDRLEVKTWPHKRLHTTNKKDKSLSTETISWIVIATITKESTKDSWSSKEILKEKNQVHQKILTQRQVSNTMSKLDEHMS